MQKIALDDLVILKQYRYPIKDVGNIKVIGYDTETINGRCELICNSWGDYCYPKSFNDILHFMCRKKTRSYIGFFYNLKYDFNAILKHLIPELWEIIFRKGGLKYDNWELKYIPKKLLVCTYINPKTKHKRTWRFYDIAQYYRMSLDMASEKYLKKRKLYQPFDLRHFDSRLLKTKIMLEYCKIDAGRCEQLADHFINICNKAGLKTKNYCSPASISTRYFQKEIKFPTINKFLEDDQGKYWLSYAWNAVSGAFISVFKKGRIENVYEYDINSAYPYHMSNFPDLYKGYFKFKKRVVPKFCFLGWIKVEIFISENNPYSYHPCIPVLRNQLPNYYPCGKIRVYITLVEYHYLKKIYDIKIIDGLYWTPETLDYPFKSIITDIYKKRKTTDDPNINYFLKIVLNGIYGKFLEKYRIIDEDDKNYGKLKTGNLFNPFIASYILAGTRLQVFDFMARQNDKDIVACFTDSVLFKNPVDIKRDDSLGAWDFASKGEALILGCGVYTIKGEKIKNKTRGFHLRDKKKFDMGYSFNKEPLIKNNLFDLCKKYYNNDKLDIEITDTLSPLNSIIQNKTDEMNIIRDKLKSVNINFDTKRVWDYYPKKAGEYLDKEIDSSPILQL